MKPTRPSTLATVAVVFALVAWLLLHSIYSDFRVPWTGAPALLLAAALEAWTGRDCGPITDGAGSARPSPPTRFRVADGRAGQASSLWPRRRRAAAGVDIYLSGS